ncbi:MAG: tyrosine-type recombinase/integrase [Vicinamibacteria bacterium]
MPSELGLTEFITDVWWPRYAERELARKTRDNYWGSYALWVSRDPLAETPISQITAEKITTWQDRCREAGATDAVITQAQKLIAGALRWAAARGDTYGLRSNPMRQAEWPSQARSKEPYVFSPRLIESVRRQILASASENPERDALLLSLMALTGARPFTALAVCVADLGPKNLSLGKTKSGRERRAPLWAPLRAEAEALIEAEGLASDAFLIHKAGGKQWIEQDFRNWRARRYNAARDAVAASVRPQDPALAARLETATPYHLCRHSYIALCLQAGWPLARISRIVDNRVDTLARHYANVIDDYADANMIDPEIEVAKARSCGWAVPEI